MLKRTTLIYKYNIFIFIILLKKLFGFKKKIDFIILILIYLYYRYVR